MGFIAPKVIVLSFTVRVRRPYKPLPSLHRKGYGTPQFDYSRPEDRYPEVERYQATKSRKWRVCSHIVSLFALRGWLGRGRGEGRAG